MQHVWKGNIILLYLVQKGSLDYHTFRLLQDFQAGTSDYNTTAASSRIQFSLLRVTSTEAGSSNPRPLLNPLQSDL